MAVQALALRQLRSGLHIGKRQQLSTQGIFKTEQAGLGKVRIVGLDGVFNCLQIQASVAFVLQRLRLHTAQYRGAATFPAVTMR